MMHSIDYLLNEIDEKWKIVNSMKVQYQHQHDASENNIEALKISIDKTIAYHIETLQIRGNWLKSHAEDISALKQSSLSQKLNHLENIAIQLRHCLDASVASVSDVDERKLRQMVTETLNQVDITEMPSVEQGFLGFSADDETMKEMIISFGNINCKKQSCVDVEDVDSFVLADMFDDMEIIESTKSLEKITLLEKDKFSTSIDGSCSEWLLNATEKVDKGNKKSFSPVIERSSGWLIANDRSSETQITENSNIFDEPLSEWLIQNSSIVPSTKSVESMESSRVPQIHETYAGFLHKENRSDSSFLIRREETLGSEETSVDNSIKSFLRSSSSQSTNTETYQYPDSSFLTHFDYLNKQDHTKYLIPKSSTTTSNLPLDDDTCQWLYKKDRCEKEKCSQDGCDLFDKQWLVTANDW